MTNETKDLILLLAIITPLGLVIWTGSLFIVGSIIRIAYRTLKGLDP